MLISFSQLYNKYVQNRSIPERIYQSCFHFLSPPLIDVNLYLQIVLVRVCLCFWLFYVGFNTVNEIWKVSLTWQEL